MQREHDWAKQIVLIVFSGLGVVLLSCGRVGGPISSAKRPSAEPEVHVYRAVGVEELRVYVFRPVSSSRAAPMAAILLFHGGGWSSGSADGAFPKARQFAALGMAAIAVQYRLADQKTTTPKDAVEDAQAAFRWVRQNADSLGVDPGRVAAYGWSAGAHLATSAAVFGDHASRPDALVLVSPAVSLAQDRWFATLVGGSAAVHDVNPIEHLRGGLPPTVIFQGARDSVTPLAGVREYCERLRSHGNVCELHVFPDVGHLFTPAGMPDDGDPQPDPRTQAEAFARARAFLARLNYVQ